MPAGEARDPKSAVPFAMIATIVIVAIVMTLVQIVALGTLPRARLVEDAAGGRSGPVHRRVGRADHDGRRGRVDGRQQRRPGAFGLAQPVRARRAGRPAAVSSGTSIRVPHAGLRHRLHVARRAGAGAAPDLRDARGGQRSRAAGRLQRHVRVRAGAAAAGAARRSRFLSGRSCRCWRSSCRSPFSFGAHEAAASKSARAFLVAGAVLYVVARRGGR